MRGKVLTGSRLAQSAPGNVITRGLTERGFTADGRLINTTCSLLANRLLRISLLRSSLSDVRDAPRRDVMRRQHTYCGA
jgi:hypothetical protein